jgi:hypothetical protein
MNTETPDGLLARIGKLEADNRELRAKVTGLRKASVLCWLVVFALLAYLMWQTLHPFGQSTVTTERVTTKVLVVKTILLDDEVGMSKSGIYFLPPGQGGQIFPKSWDVLLR